MKQKTNRPMAGKESCRERKSVSSKVTIRNSTTLIEHSEGTSYRSPSGREERL
ncbi:hypothetical protein NXV22_22490 [Bacteroides thetaiotaomicron]|nr:hypothetical protein [Bacteroides thetaiotaomicron]